MAVQEHNARDDAKVDYFYRPRRIGHCNIYVGVLDPSMDFYTNVIGLREAYRRPALNAGFLTNCNTHHDIGMVDVIGERGRSHTPGLNHLAWELETQVDLVEGFKRAATDGVEYDRTIDHEISHSVYNRDPDGNLNEVYADTKMRWYKERFGDVHKPNPPWYPGDVEPDDNINYEPDPEIVRVESAVFHPVKMAGACMVFDDYEANYDYYTDQIGLTPVLGGRDTPYAVLGGTCGMRDLSLFRSQQGRECGLHHMNFVCFDEEDLEQSIARAKQDGIDIVTEIDHESRRAVVINSPDKLKINFYVDRTEGLPRLGGVDEALAIYLL